MHSRRPVHGMAERQHLAQERCCIAPELRESDHSALLTKSSSEVKDIQRYGTQCDAINHLSVSSEHLEAVEEEEFLLRMNLKSSLQFLLSQVSYLTHLRLCSFRGYLS